MQLKKSVKVSLSLFLTVCFIVSLSCQPVKASSEHLDLNELTLNFQASKNKSVQEDELESIKREKVTDSVYSDYRFLQETDDFITDRFIVKYKDSKERNQFVATLKNDIQEIKKTKNKNFEVITTKDKLKTKDFLEIIKKKKADFSIEYIQPDYQLTTASEGTLESEENPTFTEPLDQIDENPLQIPEADGTSPILDYQAANYTRTYEINDPYLDRQWGLFQKPKTEVELQRLSIKTGRPFEELSNQFADNYPVHANVFEAWKQSKGEEIIVAVLDTGIDITHEDLADNIWINIEETASRMDDDENGYIDDIYGWNFSDNNNQVHSKDLAFDEWHGTHIAGIIAAVGGNENGIVGVAPKAKIMPLKVFKNGSAYTSDIINAIEYAEAMGAKIVNCSWGSTKENIALKEVMEKSNILFVVAAGNSSIDLDNTPVYPASFQMPNIITVASINKNGHLSPFSNYGKNTVHVTAPGEEIFSTKPNNDYADSSGTSMAAAFVSGKAALIYANNNSLSPIEVKETIIRSSDKITGLYEKIIGGNKINCGYALFDNRHHNSTLIDIIDIQMDEDITFLQESQGYSLFATDQWKRKTNMPTARTNLGVAAVNGKIYAIGGLGGINKVEEYDPETDRWTTKANMPTGRYGLDVAVVNGKIYAIGGYNGGYINKVEEYNPVTNTWTTKANMPTARSHLGVAVVNGKIYAVGGSNSSGYLNKVEEYNPVTNTWTTKASMPTARDGIALVAANESIYAVGGYTYTGPIKTVEEFNPRTNTWATKASKKTAGGSPAGTEVNGKIYVAGGYWNIDNSNLVEEYDPILNSWAWKPSLSLPRAGLGLATVGSKIYAMGGDIDGDRFGIVEELDLGWTTKTGMPTARNGLGVAAVNGKIYAIGGMDESNGYTFLNKVEEYDPVTDTWTTKANMPTARGFFGIGVVNEKIYVIGGRNSSGYLNIVEEYNPANNSWTSKPSMPTRRSYLAATVANNRIYAMGGQNSSVNYLNVVEEFNPQTNIWTTKKPMPTGRYGLGAAVSNGKVYAIGGCNGDALNIVQEYNPLSDSWINRANMPTRRYLFGITEANGKIYTIGGDGLNFGDNKMEEYDPSTDSWTGKANMPTKRFSISAVTVDNKIYAIGGCNVDNDYNKVEEYSIATNPWSFKASMPTGRSHLGVAAAGNLIYAIGGHNPYDMNYYNKVEVYDTRTNTWSVKANMPTARGHLGVAQANGKIYAIGGYNNSGYSNKVEEYDPITNLWTTKASMPTARRDLAVIRIDGKIYAIGGKNSSGDLSTVEVYDPAKNSWSQKASMPTARSALGVEATNNKIYAIGGMTSSSLRNTVEEYDPISDTWRPRTNMIRPRAYAGAASNGKIYVAGGIHSGDIYYGEADSFEEYDPVQDLWIKKPSMQIARIAPGVAMVDNKIYVIGGQQGDNYNFLDTVECYTLYQKNTFIKYEYNDSSLLKYIRFESGEEIYFEYDDKGNLIRRNKY
ncbi:Kelch repeat-containing protein [Clostridium formicaceticum]|uniref:Thermitase n=1 Tax=Clostridium formicaceticum TaxID=1497 RepID=A0AAC9RHY3_9CLOT|nr:kelch repeat-containing protein [Clostridium formicaceticum]AOY76010.1 hypothetical protein BJL90_08930 [Clostridium formicaceticum]ARE86366.1 Thermitase [Clostridium formicaceticum]